ncbi:hypothetical protein FACS189430_11810 [Bacteroidia bacterium]|nr:hypothetical protein FACS189430_11810 [Bacteroidia bacterium]
MPYIIQNKNLDKNRVFILQKSELEKRLDPLYYSLNIFGFLKTTNFKTKTIREIAKYTISGFGVGKEEQDLTEKGFIQIRPTNLDEFGSLKFDRNIYLGNEFLDKKNNIIQKGDILFNNTNSQELVGKTAYFDLDGTYLHSNHITRIKVDENIIRPKFLWLLLNFYQKRKIFYTICTNWNNQSGVGIELLNSLKIVVPDFETQDKIIAIYETAFAYKKQSESEANKLLASIDDYLLGELGITLPAENNITESVENQQGFELNKHNSVVKKGRLFLTRFSEIGGGRFDPDYHKKYFSALLSALEKSLYKKSKLGVHLSEINYGASVSNNYVKNGIPLLRIKDLKRNEINVSEVVYLPEEMRKTLGNCFVKENDFLISRSGTIGIVSIVPKNIEGFAFGSFMIKFSLKEDFKIDKHFLSFYLNSSLLVKLIEREKIGAIQGNITIPTIKNFPLILPPLEKQKEIANRIQNIRNNANNLKINAKQKLHQAKAEIETMILGE